MLATIKTFFEEELKSADSAAGMDEHKKQLASAALLIEVAIIDQEFDAREFATLQHILETQFQISPEQCAELTTLAQQECERATSMYQFTQLVNTFCSTDDKFELLVGMWRIAFADGDLDKYEEYVVRKVADLIHMAHGDFIRAKHVAKARREA